jgi:hypothetical protein
MKFKLAQLSRRLALIILWVCMLFLVWFVVSSCSAVPSILMWLAILLFFHISPRLFVDGFVLTAMCSTIAILIALAFALPHAFRKGRKLTKIRDSFSRLWSGRGANAVGQPEGPLQGDRDWARIKGRLSYNLATISLIALALISGAYMIYTVVRIDNHFSRMPAFNLSQQQTKTDTTASDSNTTSEEEPVKQTLNDFLEMCKGGHQQEAVAKYVDTSRGYHWTYPNALNNIIDYTVEPIRPGDENADFTLVTVALTVSNQGDSSWLLFRCSSDGKYILGNDAGIPPEEQAKQTVNAFLEMCKQGQGQAAVEKYVHPSLGLHWTYPEELDQLGTYHVIVGSPFYTNDTLRLIIMPAFITKKDGSEASLGFECSGDGLQIIGNDTNLPPNIL